MKQEVVHSQKYHIYQGPRNRNNRYVCMKLSLVSSATLKLFLMLVRNYFHCLAINLPQTSQLSILTPFRHIAFVCFFSSTDLLQVLHVVSDHPRQPEQESVAIHLVLH